MKWQSRNVKSIKKLVILSICFFSVCLSISCFASYVHYGNYSFFDISLVENIKIEQIEMYRTESGLEPITDDVANTQLWDCEKESLNKIVSLKNTGNVEAYARTIFAIPKSFTYQMQMDELWSLDCEKDVVIDDVQYAVLVATYGEKLLPDGVSSPCEIVFSSDQKINGNEKVRIFALSQAVSTNGCKNVNDAMERFASIDESLFIK